MYSILTLSLAYILLFFLISATYIYMKKLQDDTPWLVDGGGKPDRVYGESPF